MRLTGCVHVTDSLQPSISEMSVLGEFGDLPVIPADFIRQYGGNYSSESLGQWDYALTCTCTVHAYTCTDTL